jgi:hypothetical protein
MEGVNADDTKCSATTLLALHKRLSQEQSAQQTNSLLDIAGVAIPGNLMVVDQIPHSPRNYIRSLTRREKDDSLQITHPLCRIGEHSPISGDWGKTERELMKS